MTTALAFLERILPEEGYKCATVIHENTKYNRFFSTVDELEKFMLQEDALGRTVYHACASYKVPQSDPRSTPRNQRVLGRTKPNALAATAFWLDLDCGDKKPYLTAMDAAEAVQDFIFRTELPAPIYVGSGNGLHVYWPVHKALERVEWERYAEGLKRLCEREGLEAGRERTADISSILRTPGTHHRKSTPKLVEVGDLTGPYDLDRFAIFLEGEEEEDAHTSLLQQLPKEPSVRDNRLRTRSVPSIISAAANIYADELNFTEPVARQCGQVARLALTNGVLPEPDWYAVVGVLAACHDGPAYAHSWSQGYAGYSQSETQSRLDRSREYGPTTCARFASLNPKGCEGCAFRGKITSPIQLGRRTASLPTQQCVSNPEPNLGEATKEHPPIPKSYHWQGSALVKEGEKNNGVPATETISNYPVYLNAVQTGEAHDSHSVSMTLELPHETPKTIVMPLKIFFSASGMSEIAGAGVMVHNTDLFKAFVRDSVDMWNGARKLERRYDQFGWKDEEQSFLYGTNLYTADSVRTVIGSDEVQNRSRDLGPRRNGSIGSWSAAANQLFALGHEVQAFALLSSFAAPLMRFHASGEGGAIVSLVSDKSGTGKTTALEAAASVWGRLKGTQIIDDDTSVAKGLKLAVFGNIACTYDELYNRDPEVIRRFVLMFTNGRDKDRGTADGTLRHVRAEWQTILLLASNNSIVDILSSMDGTDAPAYRVLEFLMDTPATMDKRRGDALKQHLDANSGYAADIYLRTLLQPDTLKFIKASLPKWTEEIWNKTGATKEFRFWIRTVASVMAAGVLVKHAGLLDFSVDRISGWAIEQIQEKLQSRGEFAGHRTPLSMLVSFLDQHLLDTLVVPKSFRPGPNQTSHVLLEPRRSLLIRHELLEHKIYIEEQTLKRWLVKVGVNTEGFFRDLKEREIFVQTRRMTLGAGTTHSSGQTTVLEINSAHPAMSGHVAAVETVVTPTTVRSIR